MCSAATFCDSFEVYNLILPFNRYKNDKLLYTGTIPKDTEIWNCYDSTQFIISLQVILSPMKTLRWYQPFLTLSWSQLTDQKMVFIVESLFIWSLQINPWMAHIISKTAKDNEEVGVFQVKTIPILVIHCISLPRIV